MKVNWQKYHIVYSSIKSISLGREVNKKELKAISKLHGLSYEVVEEINEIRLYDKNKLVIKADKNFN